MSGQTFVSEILQNQHLVGQVHSRNSESDSCVIVHYDSRETEIQTTKAICHTFVLFVHASVDSMAFPQISSYMDLTLFISPYISRR